ncbi:MAG: aminotransferase class V-fold PLP-dependent enzyme, partial [Candidatus Melainabacteria bacterium]|nr:aminotransferase class V-fold PLP-dependent enzyme [Candidatus Melainabacteria bacterium]
GCTQSINMAIMGLGLNSGDVVIVSPLEHNSVMRPLSQMERVPGIKIYCLPYAKQGVIHQDDLRQAVNELCPRLCVVAEASNVTGEIVDLKRVSEICRQANVPLLVDAAQSAGWTESQIDELGISLWCCSGHKGLMGPPGVGLLYVGQDIELAPLISGGTGSQSELLEMPGSYPDHLEAGTLPGPAIAGLGAGIKWLDETGLDKVRAHELRLTEHFLGWALQNDKITPYGPGLEGNRTAVVSFSIKGMTPDRVADILDQKYDIAVRSGLNCAALAHRTLGTVESGVVRIGFGFFNTLEEVEQLCQALEHIMLAKHGICP